MPVCVVLTTVSNPHLRTDIVASQLLFYLYTLFSGHTSLGLATPDFCDSVPTFCSRAPFALPDPDVDRRTATMSPSGQSRRFRPVGRMSALPPKAEAKADIGDVRFVPEGD